VRADPRTPRARLRRALNGRYEIEREIGQGAFATVYLARDWRHERRVALKVLNADPTSETGELRFIREIRLLARLQHPHILPLLDSAIRILNEMATFDEAGVSQSEEMHPSASPRAGAED